MLDKLAGRVLLEAIGALAEKPNPYDKRQLQVGAHETPFLPVVPRIVGGRKGKPCPHCRPRCPCLKHGKY